MRLIVCDCIEFLPSNEQLLAIYPDSLSRDEAAKYFWEDYQDMEYPSSWDVSGGRRRGEDWAFEKRLVIQPLWESDHVE